jgi:uncharacterized protein
MPIAALVTALLAMLLTGLSLNVSRLRLRHRVSFGDGGHKDLLVATRAHGNALEQSLLFIVLLAALESLPGTPVMWVQGLGGVFVVARLVHAAALLVRRLLLRQVAHVVSVLAQLLAAAAIVVRLATA